MTRARTPRTIGHVVLSLDVGGLERVVASLASAQKAAGTNVVVYCLDRAGMLAAPLPGAGIPVHTIGRGPRGFDMLAVARLTQRLRADGVNVVHCHNYGALVYGAFAARIMGARVVYTIHGAKTSARRATAAFQRFRLVSEVVFVSDHARGVARAAGVASESHVHTIVNGVDAAAFEVEPAARPALRRELAIPAEAPVCGIVARLTAAKDHVTLFDAMLRVRAGHPGVHCVVVGDGELRAQLEAAVVARGLTHAVHLVGARSNVRDYLAAMDVFVLSSVTEGLAMTLLEAMAAGLPVVATRVGGNPEVVAEGETGLLVPARDPTALAAAIASVIDRPAVAAEMGRAGRARVRDRFSLEAMVRRYQDVYDAASVCG
jgi:glycosyltransferase involved in cell wall biosynthesis